MSWFIREGDQAESEAIDELDGAPARVVAIVFGSLLERRLQEVISSRFRPHHQGGACLG
jgi:hypothetical protein